MIMETYFRKEVKETFTIDLDAVIEAQDQMTKLYEENNPRLLGFELCWKILIQHGMVIGGSKDAMHYMAVMPISERVAEAQRRHAARV